MGQRGQPPILAVIFAFAAALGGCAPKPPAPAPPPPPAMRDAGLPAYDLKRTADRIATSLLADPKLNANKKSWTLAVDRMEDHTDNRAFSHDYDELLDHLRTALFQQSNGRAQSSKSTPPPPVPSPPRTTCSPIISSPAKPPTSPTAASVFSSSRFP